MPETLVSPASQVCPRCNSNLPDVVVLSVCPNCEGVVDYVTNPIITSGLSALEVKGGAPGNSRIHLGGSVHAVDSAGTPVSAIAHEPVKHGY